MYSNLNIHAKTKTGWAIRFLVLGSFRPTESKKDAAILVGLYGTAAASLYGCHKVAQAMNLRQDADGPMSKGLLGKLIERAMGEETQGQQGTNHLLHVEPVAHPIRARNPLDHVGLPWGSERFYEKEEQVHSHSVDPSEFELPEGVVLGPQAGSFLASVFRQSDLDENRQ